MQSVHGGDLVTAAQRLGVPAGQLLDASASLVPFMSRLSWRNLQRGLRDYPDRSHFSVRQALAAIHQLDPQWLLPGNGAAELFTWAARDAAALGSNVVASPFFADYQRALACWDSSLKSFPLPLGWDDVFPQHFARPQQGSVLWICNPHNPTGQLWSRKSLEPLLNQFELVICDEAFLSLVPDGEVQSMIPLVADHSNLVVVRSLTKLYAIAGLRLGYAVAHPDRLARWAAWRDPWPVNGIALAAADQLLSSSERYQKWCQRVHLWVERESAWMQQRVLQLPGLTPMPSSVNFFLIRGEQSLVSLRERVERHHGVLMRDCRSFEGLGEHWLRIGFQDRRGNRRILRALKQELR